MKLRIKAFGIAREIVGKSNLVLDVNEGASVQEMKVILFQHYPNLESLTSMFVAVNHSYADDYTILGEEDEIALIPPVSGG